LHEIPGGHGDDEINEAEIGEGAQHSHALDETRGYRRSDQRARSKAADRDAGDEPAPVGKPLDQDGDRNDVPEAKPNAADHSIAQIQPPQLICREAGEKYAEAIQKSAGERDRARPNLVQPKAAKESRHPEHEDADREGEGHVRDGPVKLLDERGAEDAPRIHSAERHLHKKSCCSNAPPIRVRHTITPYCFVEHVRARFRTAPQLDALISYQEAYRGGKKGDGENPRQRRTHVSVTSEA